MTTESETEQPPALQAYLDHLRSCAICSKQPKQPVFGLVTECDENVELFKAMMNERGSNDPKA